MKNNRILKILSIAIILTVILIPTNVFASAGKIDPDTIVTCNGQKYGSHGTDHHFHQVDEKGKAKGSNLGTDWSCKTATEKVEVKLSKCVDGDTAKFILNNTEITTRFLAVDTPETVKPNTPVQPYGKEASNYTCNTLTNAKTIEIEYDAASTKTDKYGRHLVWVYADGKMLQEELIKQGLAKVAYLYADYSYTEKLNQLQEGAKAKGVNLWSGNNEEAETEVTGSEVSTDNITDTSTDSNTEEIKENNPQNVILSIIIGIVIIIIIIRMVKNPKERKKFTNKLIREAEKDLKKRLK